MSHFRSILIVFIAFIATTGAFAQRRVSDQDERRMEKVGAEILKSAQYGPKEISISPQASFFLPADCIFVPRSLAAKFSEFSLNNDTQLVGLVMPLYISDNDVWYSIIAYGSPGHVIDTPLQKDQIDKAFKRLQSRANSVSRKDLSLKITDWLEEPYYNSSTNTLRWTFAVDAKLAQNNFLNLSGNASFSNNVILGKTDFIHTFTILFKSSSAKSHKDLQQIIASAKFNPGYGYNDFNSSGDTSSNYNLYSIMTGEAFTREGSSKGSGFLRNFLLSFVILTIISIIRIFRAKKKANAPQFDLNERITDAARGHSSFGTDRQSASSLQQTRPVTRPRSPGQGGGFGRR